MTRRGATPGRVGPAARAGAGPLATGVLLLAAAVSCAGGGRGDGAAAPAAADASADPSPGRTLSAAVQAADTAGHAVAVELLEDVRERCGPSPAGARASLLLAAVHLDPRFTDGSPQTAAERAAEYLRAAIGPAWTTPVARILYLEALEKGATAPDPAGLVAAGPPGTAPPPPASCRRAETPGAVPGAMAPSRVLPALPGAPMAERLERLRARVSELEEELERIRDVLDEP